MQTIFDWVTMAIFAGLVVLFLNRSMAPEEKQDNIYHYAPPALGCALANYLGNHDQRVVAIAIVIAVVGYILFFLQPFAKR
ncbi:MAG: XrtV sorting system accessory protein [Pseudomonadota bacterium]